jgi:hypothetical protein
VNPSVRIPVYWLSLEYRSGTPGYDPGLLVLNQLYVFHNICVKNKDVICFVIVEDLLHMTEQ